MRQCDDGRAPSRSRTSAAITPFDPSPHDTLGLVIGLEATLLSIFVLISQNQEVAKDRLAAEIDHQVNSKSEVEIGLLLRRVDELEAVTRHHAEEQKQILTRIADEKNHPIPGPSP